MVDPKSWSPQPRQYKKPPVSIEAPGYKKVEGETIPRWNASVKDGLVSKPEEGVSTIFDLVKVASERFGNAKAMGTRKLIRTHEEVKKIKKVVNGKEETVDKKWTYSELSGYEYITFIEHEKITLALGAGLRNLGMKSGDRLQIYGATSAHWLQMAHGASSQSMPIVTAYDTLGEEGLSHSLQQAKSRAIFLDAALLGKLCRPLKEATGVDFVIYNNNEEPKQADIDKLKSEVPRLKIVSIEELQESGEKSPQDPVPPKPEDLCCIMYTSGSTGAPKGVLLKHSNVIAAVAGVNVIIGKYLGPGDGMLTYLPLAHILEFVFENACLYWGGTMGYGNPRTLSDASVRNCKGDIAEFRPTALVGVPQIWETVKKGIITKVNNSGLIAKNMVWGAMAAKEFLLSTGLPGVGLIDAVVFNKIKAATGGRLRICLNGGGPVAKETQRFISMAITPMISGYGLTETSAMGALMDPAAWTDNALGEMPGSVEIKLVDYADAGYFSTNDPPQGEILIRGASVTDGYLDLEKETKESITADGWFCTGDIGEFDKDGALKIIDRKKNLVKTLSGEYIALEKLESVYRSSDLVANICVYADPNKTKPIAIIVPAEPALKKFAATNGINDDSFENLCENNKLNELVLKDLQNLGRQRGLQGVELIEGVVMAAEEWTPQNNLVTSAQKLNRKGILQKYQASVDKAYGGN